MSYIKNLDTYIKLLDNFINGQLSAANFVDEYFRLWEIDRDEEALELKDHVINPSHPLLLDLKEKRISDEKFASLTGMLYGLNETQAKARSILDRVFTTCDCFWPDIPDDEASPPLVLSERLFREEILNLFQELKLLASQ